MRTAVLLAATVAVALGAAVKPAQPTGNPCQPCDPNGYVYSIDTVTVISSPGFATNQICANAGPCVYHIYANNGQRVKINFSNFVTFGSLRLYDGAKGDDTDLVLADMKGQIDTASIPPIYSSIPKDGSGGVVTMVYHPTATKLSEEEAAVGAGANFGFQAAFTSTSDSGCGPAKVSQTLFGPAVVIKTPNYPYNYPPNLVCKWNFTAPASKLAKISFSDDAHTEANFDNVVIYNWDGSLAATDSGSKGFGSPPAFADVQGSTRGFTIAFDSDSGVDYNGFSATLSGYTPPTVCDCGHTAYVLEDVTQTLTITSPNFGSGHSGYCENANCTYDLIVRAEAYKAKVSFEVFDLETGYDHLTINDGINGFQLEDCTGQKCDARVSDDNRLTLHFVTDASVGRTGYKAIFSAVLP